MVNSYSNFRRVTTSLFTCRYLIKPLDEALDLPQGSKPNEMQFLSDFSGKKWPSQKDRRGVTLNMDTSNCIHKIPWMSE